MAYDNQSFIQKLRQNQILKPEGQGLPNPYIGMPNFMTGQRPQPQEAPIQLQSQPVKNFENVYDPNAGHIMPPNQMASAWIPGAADLNAANILLGTTKSDEHQRDIELAKTRNGYQYGNLAVKQRAQDLKEKIESGKASDAEKQEYALALIEARGNETENQIGMRGRIQENLLDTRGKQATSLQELKGTQQSGLQDVKGNQRLGEIAARAVGKGSDALKPSQQRNQTSNNIQQLILQQPELAKFLTKNPNTGEFEISPKADEQTRTLINQRISGFGNDINLPSPTYNNNTLRGLSPNGTPASKTPGSTTPTADGQTPSKTASKYSYTVK